MDRSGLKLTKVHRNGQNKPKWTEIVQIGQKLTEWVEIDRNVLDENKPNGLNKPKWTKHDNNK